MMHYTKIVTNMTSLCVTHNLTSLSVTQTLHQEVIGPAAVLVEVVENSMYRYIPPEHCKAVLSELCRALRLCYINVLTQVATVTCFFVRSRA